MRISTAVLLVLIGCTPTVRWEAPADPSPHAILNEAEQDTRAGRYDVALAKFLWFHENALELEPALSGVRRSFALSHWLELAREYPPAMAAMRQAREQAAADVLTGQSPRNSFADVAAIDRHLGQEKETEELFENLDRDQPDVAREVFEIARRALVAQKRFELANKYVDPSADFTRLVERYRRIAPEPGEPDDDGFAEKFFTHNASTLVALLAVNGRLEEAQAVAAAAREEIQDEAFDQGLASALQGIVPQPWP